ncbi:ammonium transporter [Desulfococcus multivorans]|uniref:Ammonium transporter n=1 Tax=Desulfococcus multivorans DSM 2059 TaxID=1121405 RepID=S7UPB1_DESML|nr:ammonium transporter [Desulfococcus multivorans]AQV03050.1 ammonium transporter [Desulfococcus multivorans]EPR34158.1 ammonium transporter [Desulfococcus multivorans DSM 2059]SKA19566.1 ammonium transporter [Desulfococcus multivorans DSM 2059]
MKCLCTGSTRIRFAVVLMSAVLFFAFGAAALSSAEEGRALQKAVEGVPGVLLKGKTQEEIRKDLPVSGAYRDETTPIAEDVEVTVAGKAETVSIVRYLSDLEILQYRGDVLWTCIAAFLVFIMQAGFAMVESGFTRAKNAVNIMMKNIMDFCIGTIAFLIIGFHIMFAGPDEPLFFLGKTEATQWGFAFWLFQCVFAATTATIVSGGVAERCKFTSYLIYSLVICAVIYPIFGGWAWGSLLDGSGWLEAVLGVGFYDFAGSTVVHSIGGWLALAGALVIGPRVGKFDADGTPKAIPGHNLPFAVIGGFILWLGWFGFNPGSTTTFDGNLARIAVMTNIAGAAGGIGAMAAIWFYTQKPDVGMTVNGFLAGMVAVCAAVDVVNVFGALIIGLVAGVLVVFSVIFIERKLKVDDPVGCVSVHGVCGAWGTLAYAVFGVEQFSMTVLAAQLVGIGVAFAWSFGCGMALFLAIKHTVGLRVTAEEEEVGLDIKEHGNEAYSGLQVDRHSY